MKTKIQTSSRFQQYSNQLAINMKAKNADKDEDEELEWDLLRLLLNGRLPNNPAPSVCSGTSLKRHMRDKSEYLQKMLADRGIVELEKEDKRIRVKEICRRRG